MANFRTQLGLGQITASFGRTANGDLKGSILDNLSAAASGSIVTNDLSGSLSHIASAIKRMHGHDSFSEALAGVFNNASSVFSGSIVVKDSSEATTFDVDRDGNVNASGNVVITGDLTVNGQTTTLNTTNTTFEDRIIALASGSSPGNVDSGIIFTRASANLGGGSDKKHGALQFDGATGNIFKLGVTNDDASGTTLDVANDDLSDLYVGKLLIDGATNHIDVTSTNLTATAAADFTIDAVSEINLDADGGAIRFLDGTDGEIGSLKLSGGGSGTGLMLSSSLSQDLVLDSNSSKIILGNEYDGAQGVGIGLNIGGGASTEVLSFIKANDVGGNEWTFKVETESGGNQENQYVGVSGSLRYYSGSNYVALRAPTLGSNYTLTLPDVLGSQGQVLKLNNATGDLTFGDATGDLDRIAVTTNQTITALTVVSLGTPKQAGLSILSGSSSTENLNISKADGDRPKAVEVFVNGMLMVSGTDANTIAGNVDYTLTNNSSIKFAFDLELDDVVQVIQR